MSDRTPDEPEYAVMERRWAKAAGSLRYEDIPAHLIRPMRVWRPPAVERASGGGSSMAMCAELGGSPMDASPRKQAKTVDTVRMMEMLRSGLTQRETAARLGVTSAAVWVALQRVREKGG